MDMMMSLPLCRKYSAVMTDAEKQYEKSHDDIEVKRVNYVQFSGDITNTGIFKSILELLHSF